MRISSFLIYLRTMQAICAEISTPDVQTVSMCPKENAGFGKPSVISLFPMTVSRLSVIFRGDRWHTT